MICEAHKFIIGDQKTHGCIEIPCEACGVSYCLHWPRCPRCVFSAVLKARPGASHDDPSLFTKIWEKP